MIPTRVVFDTNVVLSALVFPIGMLARLRRLWSEGVCTPLMSRETGGELVRALAYPKFQLSAQERETLLFEYLPFCEEVEMPRRLPQLPQCRDPNDRMFIILATVGKADALVTGDRALLALSGKITTPILKPAAFLAQQAGRRQQGVSLEEEARRILSAAVALRRNAVLKRAARLRAAAAAPSSDPALDSARLIRQDRAAWG